MVLEIQSTVPSAGNENSGRITPTMVRMAPETDAVVFNTFSSPPNHDIHRS